MEDNNLIYHYTNFKAIINIVKTKSFRLTSANMMNDLTDRCFGNIYVLTTLLTSKEKNLIELRNNLTYDQIMSISSKTLNVPYYSMSFCKHDNDYLWEKYADERRGVALCLNLQHFKKEIEKYFIENQEKLDDEKEETDFTTFFNVREITYSNDKNFLKKVTDDMLKLCKSYDQTINYELWLHLITVICGGFIKDKCYSEEKEYRILFRNKYTDELKFNNFMTIFDEQRYGKALKKLGLLTPQYYKGKEYVELSLKNIFTSSLVPYIVIGSDFRAENLTELRKTLDENGLSDTLIIPYEEFRNKS